MASLTVHLSVVALFLSAIQLISGYSFRNCIAHLDGKSFGCLHRQVQNISAIISDLPPSATTLNISFTYAWKIHNSSFAHLSNLQNLRMDQNKLRVIDEQAFQNLHDLQSLNLSFNNLSELRPLLFEDLHNLTFLSLENNTLKELPEGIFSSLLNLSKLLLKDNLLKDFSGITKSVSHLDKLMVLDLCYNNLTSLSHSNVSLPKSLTKLFLCRNNLKTLGCDPSFLSSVKMLDLSFNLHLPATAFQGVDLRNLNYLGLQSTSVKVVQLLNISNVSAGHINFSGTGLKNDSLLNELCASLEKKVRWIKYLRLNSNGIENITKQTLFNCPNITGALDLSHNQLRNIGCLNFLGGQKRITKFSAEHNHLTEIPSCDQHRMYFFEKLEDLSYRYNRILIVNSFAFIQTQNLKVLKLNINNIAFLDREALKGLTKLETLRLDNNLLTDLFNETFADNVNLKTLNLRNNRISVIFNGIFQNLRNLTILDLGGNKITQFQASGFSGLKSLSKLYLDGNSLKQIDTSFYHEFQNTLTVLDLQSNQIRFLKENVPSPFTNFSKLRDLKLDKQRPYGLTILPYNLFRGLHSLKSLYLTHNNIFRLDPETFDDLTSLQFLTLDNCCVGGVAQLQPGVFKNLKNLTKLVVENMGIQNFSKEVFGNLTQLRTLQLNRNVMHSIPVDALESLPKLSYIDIRDIPLSCTCTNILLQNYTVHNPNVQVVYLYNMPCQQGKRNKFYNFDTKVCYLDIGEYMFFSTAAAILLFTLTPLLYVKLYWKVKYGYYVFRSWFSDHWSRIRDEEENCKYDAFISYNSSDEEWVMDYLLPNLEGHGSSFKLCLHHRDFELGRDIVDNIVNAVYSSRKTICVVSRNFLRSEWCSLEIQLASYRLFDEYRDVLLLVFLEPISGRQLSSYHRMRKVMLKKTYLQWPGSDCTNPVQAQELFWNQLRRAIRTKSRQETEENDINDHAPESKKNELFEDHSSDENYYLLP
ncbi:toll-like receptor 21 [Cololabis saira]|uniref:toll-like receptor 21 n=1 Tax=Cololabis saira TaxID=129043 RepID=UPI002AD2864E|nr:toll-like receptor 21 [Cololabis saira]